MAGVCLWGLAFGSAFTYYITPAVFALEFGDDCATASSILDTMGLVASVLFQLAASEMLSAGDSSDNVVTPATQGSAFSHTDSTATSRKHVYSTIPSVLHTTGSALNQTNPTVPFNVSEHASGGGGWTPVLMVRAPTAGVPLTLVHPHAHIAPICATPALSRCWLYVSASVPCPCSSRANCSVCARARTAVDLSAPLS